MAEETRACIMDVDEREEENPRDQFTYVQ